MWLTILLGIILAVFIYLLLKTVCDWDDVEDIIEVGVEFIRDKINDFLDSSKWKNFKTNFWK